MPNRASLNKDLGRDRHPNDLLDEVYDNLEDLLEYESHISRVERNFAGDDVFVQTDEYNVFVKEDGLVFHGLDSDGSYDDPVLEYLQDLFDVDFDDDLDWY